MSFYRAGGFLATRGLGGSVTHVLVQGFLPVVIEEVLIKRGRSYKKEKSRKYDKKTKRYYDEYNIYVELTSVNGKDLFEPIINNVKYKITDEDLKITVQPTKLTVQSPDIKVNVKMVEKK